MVALTVAMAVPAFSAVNCSGSLEESVCKGGSGGPGGPGGGSGGYTSTTADENGSVEEMHWRGGTGSAADFGEPGGTGTHCSYTQPDGYACDGGSAFQNPNGPGGTPPFGPKNRE
jgi:hypothetical protein